LEFHYGKHHASYVAKLNSIVSSSTSSSLKSMSLEQILRADLKTLPPGTYNSAAQTWNHSFYWDSLAPVSTNKHTLPSPRLGKLIDKSFGSFDAFKTKFSDAAGGHFGSGWAWLVQEKANGLLKVTETHDGVSAYSGLLFRCSFSQTANFLCP
jgi:superoxide dismutase, Fe-Mn family